MLKTRIEAHVLIGEGAYMRGNRVIVAARSLIVPIGHTILCAMRLMPVNKHKVPNFKNYLYFSIPNGVLFKKNYNFDRVVPLFFSL